MVRGIRIDPGASPEICNVPDTAQGWDALLVGHTLLQYFSCKPAALVYVPGLPGRAMPNRRYAGNWYYGSLLIVGWKRGHVVPLRKPLAAELAEHFKPVEVSRL